ncbi:hypothetical protein JKY72_01535, partial [Candidatus Gracilibacteria bacterium]|nr:hypothetical protein [Candidatus Gracilibacteria bacterium]
QEAYAKKFGNATTPTVAPTQAPGPATARTPQAPTATPAPTVAPTAAPATAPTKREFKSIENKKGYETLESDQDIWMIGSGSTKYISEQYSKISPSSKMGQFNIPLSNTSDFLGNFKKTIEKRKLTPPKVVCLIGIGWNTVNSNAQEASKTIEEYKETVDYFKKLGVKKIIIPTIQANVLSPEKQKRAKELNEALLADDSLKNYVLDLRPYGMNEDDGSMPVEYKRDDNKIHPTDEAYGKMAEKIKEKIEA